MRIDATTLVYRNRHLLWLMIAIAVVAGLSTMLTIPRLEDPRIVNRGPLVITAFPGASAERVEALVSDPIETALEEIDEIKTIESTSRAGISLVSIELLDRIGADENKAIFSEIRDELGEVAALLPDGAGTPALDDQRNAVAYTLVVMVRASESALSPIGLVTRQAEQLADELRGIPGTELVRVFGAPKEEVRVTVDERARALAGLTVGEVAALIEQADSKGSAGVVRGPASDVLIEVTGELDTLERIAAIPLRESDDGRVLRVGDIASVERTVREPVPTVALTDGERGVLVAARVGPAVQADAWTETARSVVASFSSQRSGVVADTVFEQTRYTTERLVDLGANLFAGVCVILVVIWLTMGFREALIVGAALPIVVALTVTTIQASGNSLHQMSIFGIIISLGLLIDNAIVVVDEIAARRRAGEPALQAVSESVRHLAAPLGASTLTTVLAFAPILLLPGGGGDFVGSIGQSVIFAVVFSFVISLTVIAGLAGVFVRGRTGATRRWWRDGVGSARAGSWLRRAMTAWFRRPIAVSAIALVPPGIGFALVPTLGNQFFPPVDRDMFQVQLWMPSDASIARTEAAAREAERIIRGHDGVERVHWLVGGSYPSVWYNLIMDQDGSGSYAHGVVDTVSPEATKLLVRELQGALDRGVTDAQIVVKSFGQGPPVVADIEYRIAGPDPLVLQKIGEAFRERLHREPDVVHTQMSIGRAEPKLWFDVDERSARLAGLTLDGVAEQVAALSEGSLGGTVLEDLEEMPVRVIASERTRADLSLVASTALTGAAGALVPLPAVAEPVLRPETGSITRYQGERANVIQAYTRAGALPIDIGDRVLADLMASGPVIPVGYEVTVGGAAEQNDDATGNLAKYAPILVVLMIATLVLTFKSVLLAGVLGVVAVMSVGLAMLSTWVIDFPVSFNTILGTLGLIGVAINDSVVVIATLRAHPTARLGDPHGVAEAVMSCLRHVVSTTLTTIGGFLPLLVFIGGDFWPSLAIVLAGGITGATLLAVLFVPSMFILIASRTASRADASETTAALPEGLAAA